MSKLSCGCTPDASGYGYCGDCNRALRSKIWREMSEAERSYDRRFAPQASAKLDEEYCNDTEYDECCSCHICPPCNYCLNNKDEEK